MRTRLVKVMVAALGAAVTVAACSVVDTGPGTGSGTASPGASSTATGTTVGVFHLPVSACDLLDQTTIAKLAGRNSVTFLKAGDAQAGAVHNLLTCTFTSGILPVGLFTIDTRPVDTGKTADQELADSIAGGLYKSASTESVPGLGDAARYGEAASIGGLTYATVWAVRIEQGQVLDVTLTVSSHNPAAEKPGLLALAKTTFDKISG
jgi:hypothetical protein